MIWKFIDEFLKGYRQGYRKSRQQAAAIEAEDIYQAGIEEVEEVEEEMAHWFRDSNGDWTRIHPQDTHLAILADDGGDSIETMSTAKFGPYTTRQMKVIIDIAQQFPPEDIDMALISIAAHTSWAQDEGKE